MNKINSKANSKEVLEACQGIVDLNVKTPIAEDAYYTLTYTKLSERCSKLIEKINEGGLKSVLKEKDDLRDTDVRAIFYEVEAKCNRRQGAQQASALNVSAALEQYGINIISDSYLNESAQIRGVLSDLKSPALAEDVKAIPDLAELITNLEQSQKAFDDSNSEWLEQKQERKIAKSATELSAECRNIVNNELTVYIAAMSAANPDKYKDFADKMETLITDINNKVRDRIAAYKRKKETEAEAEV
jgi:hypothetical protein